MYNVKCILVILYNVVKYPLRGVLFRRPKALDKKQTNAVGPVKAMDKVCCPALHTLRTTTKIKAWHTNHERDAFAPCRGTHWPGMIWHACLHTAYRLIIKTFLVPGIILLKRDDAQT